MNEDFYINLIYKKLAGEISASERKQLNAWIAASEANKAVVLAVEKAWQSSDLLQPAFEVDLDEEFQGVEALLTAEEAPQVIELKRNNASTINWLSIAAGFLVVAVVAFLLRGHFIKSSASGGNKIFVVTKQEQKTITLPDRSIVHLNEHSEMSYPEVFDAEERIVELTGEAFFVVEHQDNKPFKVITAQETITVLGTTFNVNTASPEGTSVYVASGRVKLAQRHTGQEVVLNKEEKGVSDPNKGRLQKLGQQSVNEIAWHTKRLNFIDVPLAKVQTALETHYDMSLEVNIKELKDCPVTITFDHQNRGLALESLAIVLGGEIKELGNDRFQLLGGSCQ